MPRSIFLICLSIVIKTLQFTRKNYSLMTAWQVIEW